MITITSLRHPSMIAKIDSAMRAAIAAIGQVFIGMGSAEIVNKRGEFCIECIYCPSADTAVKFRFYDLTVQYARDITDNVLAVLRTADIAPPVLPTAKILPFTVEPKVVEKHWPQPKRMAGYALPNFLLMFTLVGLLAMFCNAVVAAEPTPSVKGLLEIIDQQKAIIATQDAELKAAKRQEFVLVQSANVLHQIAHDSCTEYCDGIDQMLDKITDEAGEAYDSGISGDEGAYVVTSITRKHDVHFMVAK